MRRLAAVAAAFALSLTALPAAAGAPGTSGTGEPEPPQAPADSGALTLDDAQLAWGLNLESSNKAFAPGTVNMFGAGAINPGGGGRTVTAAAWRQRAGQVRVEKAGPDGRYRPATWAGLTTQPDGSPLVSPTSGHFSHHRVVLDGGTGEVDPDAGTAAISWRGTFSVLYYSGMSTFTVSDPRLVVTEDRAVLHGTLGGWGSDMDDPSRWVRLEPTPAVLADLDRRAVELPETGGFTSVPRYAGRPYDAPRGAAPQVRSGPDWGAWPRSFVDFQQEAGSGSYWYSSGLSTDPYKAPTELAVSWEAGAPVATTAPPTVPGTDTPEVPDVPDAPAPPPAPTTTAPLPTPQTRAVEGSGATSGATSTATSGRTPPGAAVPNPPAPVPPPVTRALTPLAAPATPEPDHRWHWWLGALLLLGAAALLLPRPSPLRRSRTTPRGNR